MKDNRNSEQSFQDRFPDVSIELMEDMVHLMKLGRMFLIRNALIYKHGQAEFPSYDRFRELYNYLESRINHE